MAFKNIFDFSQKMKKAFRFGKKRNLSHRSSFRFLHRSHFFSILHFPLLFLNLWAALRCIDKEKALISHRFLQQSFPPFFSGDARKSWRCLDFHLSRRSDSSHSDSQGAMLPCFNVQVYMGKCANEVEFKGRMHPKDKSRWVSAVWHVHGEVKGLMAMGQLYTRIGRDEGKKY